MREVGSNVKIRAPCTHVPRVSIWYVKPLDCAVIPGCANLGLARTSAPRKYHGPDRVQMATETELEFEVCTLGLGTQGVEGQFMFGTPPASH